MFSAIKPVKPGMIIIWKGATNDLPPGWALCNGSNGTPDLRDNMIIGAGSTYAVGDSGGSATAHTHTITQTAHSHTMDSGGGVASGSGYNPGTRDTTITVSNVATAVMPPYYALAYIMKL